MQLMDLLKNKELRHASREFVIQYRLAF